MSPPFQQLHACCYLTLETNILTVNYTGDDARPRSLLDTITESSLSAESLGNVGKASVKNQVGVEAFPEYEERYDTTPKVNEKPESVKQRRCHTVVYAEAASNSLVRFGNGDNIAIVRPSTSRTGSRRKARPRSVPAGLATLSSPTHYAVYDPSVYHGATGQQLVQLVPVTPVLAQTRYRRRDKPTRVPPGAHLGTNYTTYVKPPRRPLSYSPGDFEQIGHGYNPSDQTEEHAGARSENDKEWEDVTSTRSVSTARSSLRKELRRMSTNVNNAEDLDRLRRLLQEHCRLAEPEDPSYHPPNYPRRRLSRASADERAVGNRTRSVSSTPAKLPITPANSLRRPKRIPSTRSPYSMQRSSSRGSRVPRRTPSQRSCRSDTLKEPDVPIVATISEMVEPVAPPTPSMTPASKELLEAQKEILQRRKNRESMVSQPANKRASTLVEANPSGSNSPTSGHTMVNPPRTDNDDSEESKLSSPEWSSPEPRNKGKERAVESPANPPSNSGESEEVLARESNDNNKSSGETGTTDRLVLSVGPEQVTVAELSTGTETPPEDEVKPKQKQTLGKRLLKPYYKMYWLIHNSRYPGGRAPKARNAGAEEKGGTVRFTAQA